MRWGECLWSNYIWVIYGSSYRKFWVHELLVYIKVVQKVYKHGKFKGMWFTNPNFSMDPFLKLICPRTLLWPLSVLVTLSWSHKRKPDTLPIPVLNLWILLPQRKNKTNQKPLGWQTKDISKRSCNRCWESKCSLPSPSISLTERFSI